MSRKKRTKREVGRGSRRMGLWEEEEEKDASGGGVSSERKKRKVREDNE